MAKKKKKIYEENKKFAPGGSAVSEWEENQRNTFTQGRTINLSDTSKRYNTGLDEEYYEPVKNETYKTYVASKLSQAYNPKNRLNITAKDLSSYSNARKKLILANPKANIMTQGEFTSQYKANVDKKYRLAQMVENARILDYKDTASNIRSSYNNQDALKNVTDTKQIAKKLLQDIADYKEQYGNDKSLAVLSQTANNHLDLINNKQALQIQDFNDLEKKAKLTDDEKRRFTDTIQKRDDTLLKDNEFMWKFSPEERPGKSGYYGVDKKELKGILTKRGLTDEEADRLLKYETDKGTQEAKDIETKTAKYNAQYDKKTGGSLGRNLEKLIGQDNVNTDVALGVENWTDEVAGTILAPEKIAMEKMFNVSNNYSQTYKNEKRKQATKDMSGVGKFAYDFSETLAEIYGSSMTGGAVNFAAQAADDGYYQAKQNGADDKSALMYGGMLGGLTGAIYKFGIPGVKKIFSKALSKVGEQEASGLMGNLAKKIVAEKGTDSLGKALAKQGAKSVAGGMATFGGISLANQAARDVSQYATLGDKSDFELLVKNYKANGLSGKEARKQASEDFANQYLEGFKESLLQGAILGGVATGIQGIRQGRAYNEMRNTAEELRGEYEKYTTDKSSPYFENIETPEELQRQYKEQSKLLHPDVETGSEEAFRTLNEDKERIEGILKGEYSKEGLEAIDKWENFVNQAREMLGMERELTTKEKRQFATKYDDVKNNLLELRDVVANTEPINEEEDITKNEIINKIDTQVQDLDVGVEEINAPALIEPITEPEIAEIEPIQPKEVSLDNINDRQAEVLQSASDFDLPERTQKSMLANDSESVSPQEQGKNQLR